MPIAGRPEVLLAAADALARAADGLDATVGDLDPALRAAVSGWRGAAAARADERFRDDLDALRRASQACRAIAPVLRAHADVLARARRDAADGEQLGATDPATGARVVESAEQGLALAAEDAARVVRDAASLLPEPVDAERGTLLDGLRKAGGDLAEELTSTLSGALDHVNPFSDRFDDAWSRTGSTVTAVATTNPMTTLGAVVDGVAAPIAESYRTGGVDEATGRGAGAIAAALLGGKGLTKVGKVTPEAPPPPSGIGPPAFARPQTHLVPGGGLGSHETLGGHTLAPRKAHVGATDRQMLDRLERSPRLRKVSSFYDRATAENAVAENLRRNHTAVRSWLDRAAVDEKESFQWEHRDAVGRTAVRGEPTSEVTDERRSTVVLRKDPRAPDGYYVLTSHPGD